MIDMTVCCKDSKQYIANRCGNCSGTSVLKRLLDQRLHDGDSDVLFQQGDNTRRSKIVTRFLSIADFVELLVKYIVALASRSFLTQWQSNTLSER